MNKNEKMLTVAKVLWITGIIVEMLLLFVYAKSYMLKTFDSPGYFYLLMPARLIALWEIFGICVLVALKIISDIANDKPIFNYFLAAFLIQFTWLSFKLPIVNYAQKAAINGIKAPGLVLNYVVYSVLALATFKILYALSLSRVSVFTKNGFFRWSGILLVVAACINVVYTPVYFAISQKHQSATAFFSTLNRISVFVWTAYTLLVLTALAILIIAVLQIKQAPSQQFENRKQNSKLNSVHE
jgi:heme exporter protein D